MSSSLIPIPLILHLPHIHFFFAFPKLHSPSVNINIVTESSQTTPSSTKTGPPVVEVPSTHVVLPPHRPHESSVNIMGDVMGMLESPSHHVEEPPEDSTGDEGGKRVVKIVYSPALLQELRRKMPSVPSTKSRVTFILKPIR